MNTAILLVDSVTYAIKARRALARMGISSKIKKVSSKESEGCRYGVFIERPRLYEAMARLSNEGIPYSQWRGGEA